MGRLRLDVMAAVSLAALGSLELLAAGKPPKPQPVTATLEFRCLAANPGGSPSPCDDFVDGGTDRIRDDGASYAGLIYPDGLFTPVIATPENGRVVNMLFGFAIAGTRTCDGVNNCHPNGPTDGKHLVLNHFQFRVKPLIEGTWEDLPGLLFGMSTCGAQQTGMVHTTFWLADGNGHWGFNFNPRGYPGTSPVTVVRVAPQTWTVEAADTNDIGELISFGHSGLRGKNGPSREGRFNMPFQATIVSDGLPAGAGSCT